MTAVLKTNGPSGRGDASRLRFNEALVAADFAAERYALNGAAATFADLLAYTRGTAMRYLHPVTRALADLAVNVPCLYTPDGRKALNLSGVNGAIFGSAPTGPGTSGTTYAAGNDNNVVPLICYGGDGAQVSVSGDCAAVDDRGLIARPYRPALIRLTGGSRSLNFTFGAGVICYKLGSLPWAEWLGTNMTNAVATPVADLTPGAVAAVNSRDKLEIVGRYIPHEHRAFYSQTHNLLNLVDANGNYIRLRLAADTCTWELAVAQTVATSGQPAFSRVIPILKPRSDYQTALQLDFRILWDKIARRLSLWVNGRLTVVDMTMPEMGALTAANLGRQGTSLPRCSIAHLAIYAGKPARVE
ncbi:hypothetical protein [Paracoccus sp. KR1-242]|uniref:hypothetical protein n=1 Tax=Paracoccus sp. KR1-242 TaxID=3410028 RepID=UPI003BFFB098